MPSSLGGWTRQEALPKCSLAIDTDDGDGAALADALDAVRPLSTTARITGRWGADFVTLEVADSGTRPLVMTDHGHGTLQATFDQDDLAVAEAAFNGDTAAALRLTGAWKAVVTIDPACLLAAADPTRHWLVVENAQAVEQLLTGRPW
jgi:hypothetical protein